MSRPLMSSAYPLTSPATARPVTPLGILAQKLEQLAQTASQSNCIDDLDDLIVNLQQAHALAAGLDPYLESCTTSESAALAALAQKTAAVDWSKHFTDGETVTQLEQEMLSGHVEGQALKMFVYMTQAKRVLEVGMFTGYSTLAMAEALPEAGQIVACEVDPYVANFAQSCFDQSPHGSKICVKVAPALETLQALAAAQASFDLVFIDADKRGYIDYFKLLLDSNLLAPGGFICVDNTLLQGQPYLSAQQRTANGDAVAQFNRTVALDSRVEQVLLPLRDGLTIIRRVE